MFCNSHPEIIVFAMTHRFVESQRRLLSRNCTRSLRRIAQQQSVDRQVLRLIAHHARACAKPGIYGVGVEHETRIRAVGESVDDRELVSSPSVVGIQKRYVAPLRLANSLVSRNRGP